MRLAVLPALAVLAAACGGSDQPTGGPGGSQDPVANPDSYSVPKDTWLMVAAPGVLGNDVNPDGDTLFAKIVTSPSHAAAFALPTNGAFQYRGAAGYTGPDSFTYFAEDSQHQSAPTTVSITVTP